MLSPSKKFCIICLIKSPLKIIKNFLFHLKNFFRSQAIEVFVTTFWSCWKNSLIRIIGLTSKFMTSQPGLQTNPAHILPNISQSKGYQTMKFGQLIEHNTRNMFLQKLCGKWGRVTSSRPLYFFKKLNMKGKQVVCSLVLIYFDSPQLVIQ